MRVARKYSDYLVYQLLESVMVTTKEFKQIIHDMPNNDKIADILYSIIDDKTDIKTNYNLVDTSKDKNDEISFLPDNQYQRFLSKGDDFSTKTKSNAKIGRMVNQILKDNGHTQFSDSDVEKFINNFKTVWNKKNGTTVRKTELVKGKDILKWYNINNYNSDKGTLGSSCMRYEKVNHFMNIYAENPDKISMVIITEEGKLIARALFWVLDETSQGEYKKFYLDRIYTEQDSDFQFIYDWVVENLCNKDPKILASHKNGENQYEMKVFLNKTTFEHYPYADSFNYLYQRIDKDGRPTGGGYVSNFNRLDEKDIIKEYVISEIRNHSEGLPSRYSHQYSKKLDIFIDRKEAIHDSIVGWIPQSMCKKSNYEGEWIYEENAVWSEGMQDWISKDDAIDSPDFGIVHKGVIIKVAYEYIGKYTHPMDVVDALEKGEKLFELKTILKNDSSLNFYIPEYRHGGERYYMSELLGKDFWNEWQIKLASLEYFDCGDYSKIVRSDSELYKFSFLVKDRDGKAYLTKNDAILFGLTPGEKSYWISLLDFKGSYEYMNYVEFIDFVNSSNIEQSIKDKVIAEKTKFHEYFMERSGSYRKRFELYTKMKGVKASDCYLDTFDSIWKNLLEDVGPNIEEKIKEKFEYYSVEISDSLIQKAWEVISGLVLANIYYNDTNDARSRVHDWISKDFKNEIGSFKRNGTFSSDSTLSDSDFTEICRMAFRVFTDEFRDIKRKVAEKFADEYNISRDTFLSFINEVDLSEINPFL